MDGQHRCGAAARDVLDPDGAEQSVTARFRRIAEAHHGCLAVEDAGARLTYGELDALANGVARAIVERRGETLEPVVLLLHQGVTSVVATLGVLAAGRPYVPLDPTDPPVRLARIADRVGARLVLTDEAGTPAAQALRAAGREVLSVGDAPLAPAGPPPPAPDPGTAACVYFTSGSTGEPKGVLDVHRNLVHNAARYTATLGIGPSDRLSLLQPPGFSGAASSTFAALLNGAALFPMRSGGDRIAELAAEIRRRRITIYHSVPSILRSLLAVDGGAFGDVRVVRLEGDRASSRDVALHRGRFPPTSILADGLGTTETGLCRQLRLAAGDSVPGGILPVGQAVPGVDVEVVDPAGRPLPPGRIGEIAVRGRHLALGYWDRPDLTRAAFTCDADDPGLRSYRTGDLGRLAPDGLLEYLGRVDGGLKVLGRRVEPAEIEADLLVPPGVLEAAVTTYPGRRAEGRLAAHLVVDGGGLDHLAIREALVARLPAAMVPATIVFVDALPLTANGKVDRAALAPARRAVGAGPRDEVEAMVMEVWREVLERDDLGAHDDFLAAGGDALAAAEMLAALEERAGRPVPQSLLVRASTVAGVADELAGDAWHVGGLVPLQPRGRGTPLVLVHGLDSSTNSYAWLVRSLGTGRPVWGLDAGDLEWASIDDVAREHAATLRATRSGSPHLLAGFCSGAIVALEVARRLRAEGSEGVLLLIGVGAIDFPTLVSSPALARYRAARRPMGRLRRGLTRGRGAGLPPPALRRGGFLAIARRIRAAAGRAGRRDASEPARRALRDHAPRPLSGDATLYLSAEATPLYSTDPARDWAGLADRLRVEILPGTNDDLLREPIVGELARRIRSAIETAGL